MKAAVIASAVMLLSGAAVYAEDYGPTYSNTIHQSAGDRDSRGTPKYNQEHGISRERGAFRERGALREREAFRERRIHEGRLRERERSTTGAGSSFNRSGPFYDNSIHQSAGDRDSRGTPKYNNGGR